MVLHARKKHLDSEQNPHPQILTLPTGQATPSKPNRVVGHRRRRNCIPAEIRYALSAVSLFLAVGFLLGMFMLHHHHRKVIYHIMADPWGHGKGMRSVRAGFRHHFYTGNPRSVTVVMPSVVNPAKRPRRLQAILETWGPSARAVYVVHNVTEFPEASHAVLSAESSPQDPYSYPQLMLVPEDIGVDDGVPRLNYVIRAVYEKINPDFAFFVNDHTFVLPEHLCYFLEDEDPAEDMYAGHALKNHKDVFNSGAAGYVLSRETMRRLIQKWDEEDEVCLVKDGSKWLQGNPGLVQAKCLKERLGVSAVDTRREQKWHRFHAFPLTRVVSGAVDEWYRNKHHDMDKMMPGLDESYTELLDGPDCCAEDSISFHYVESFEARALFSTREALLTNPHMSSHELKALMRTEWPRSHQDIGGYSRGLPKEDDTNAWEKLLTTIRKISQRHTQREC